MLHTNAYFILYKILARVYTYLALCTAQTYTITKHCTQFLYYIVALGVNCESFAYGVCVCVC